MTPRTPLWARSIAAFSVVAALVFFSSGGLDYWQGWVYVAASLAVLGLSRWFLRDDPGLVAERLRPGKGVKWWDKGYFLLATPLFVAASA